MEKELCAKFCGILISSREVTKLQSFELGVSDVIPANVKNNSSRVSFAYFCYNCQFYGKKNLLHSFMVVLTVSHKLLSCKVLNDQTTSRSNSPHTRK